MKGGHEIQNCYVFFNFQALFLKMNIFEVATFFSRVTTRGKNVATSKIYILRKRVEKLKKHRTFAFHDHVPQFYAITCSNLGLHALC